MAVVAEIREASVDVPTEVAGFLLVTHLPGTPSRNTQDGQGRWTVRVPVSGAAGVTTLLEKVQPWLRQEGIAETSVRVGADVYRVGVDSAELTTRGGR
jgi:hypothetical protein